MIKKIKFTKFLHKKLQNFRIQSPYKFKLGFYLPKKKIYVYKFKQLLQTLKLGNSFSKKLLYNLYYFLTKIYNLYFKL